MFLFIICSRLGAVQEKGKFVLKNHTHASVRLYLLWNVLFAFLENYD